MLIISNYRLSQAGPCVWGALQKICTSEKSNNHMLLQIIMTTSVIQKWLTSQYMIKEILKKYNYCTVHANEQR